MRRKPHRNVKLNVQTARDRNYAANDQYSSPLQDHKRAQCSSRVETSLL